MSFCKNIILFAIILSSPLVAQSFGITTFDTTNCIESTNKINNIKLFNKEIYQNNYLLKKQLNSNLLFNTKLYMLNSNNYNLNQLYYGNYLYSNSFISQKDYQIMQSQKELYRILAIKYKQRNKYDLGTFGTYLGISKNVTAVIIAIISVIK